MTVRPTCYRFITSPVHSGNMNSIYESYTIPEIQCVLAALFNGFQQYDQNGTKPYSVLIGPRLLITSLVNDRGCYIKHSQHF